ncbi:MAG: hypothetical protein Q9165_007807 [Trypethelium subeluteriae]
MAGVDLALATVGAVDVTLRYGKILVETCRAFKHAEKEICERALHIESCWKRTSLQLDFLGRVWNELDQEHQSIQSEILTVLNEKVRAADQKLNSYLREHQPSTNVISDLAESPTVKVKRFKYAALKESLDKTIRDMESWQKMFDPSWFLIMRVASEHVDNVLDRSHQDNSMMMILASSVRDSLREDPQKPVSIFLPENGLETAKFIDIPFSSAKLAQRAHSTKWLLVDPIPCDSLLDFNQRKKAIRDLARKLMTTDPSTFALLKCVGAVPKASHEFLLVFRTPHNVSHPRTLRSTLLLGDIDHSLSERFRIATQLSRAICSIHTFGFVHKSIRPENIMLFQDDDSALGSAFLIGFEKIRPEEGASRLIGDNAWEKNLYRHPERQGVRLQAPYVMQHDIYSLGVCLLEIGLWQSFVHYNDTDSDHAEPGSLEFAGDALDSSSRAESVKNELVALAEEKLPNSMGSRYAMIVKTCLTCLDEGIEDFGDEAELQDEDGVLVAVRYIEKLGKGTFVTVEMPSLAEHWLCNTAAPEDVDKAVRIAYETYRSGIWSKAPRHFRADVLDRIADVLQANIAPLITLEVRQTGRACREMKAQVPSLVKWFKYFSSILRTEERPVVPTSVPDGVFNVVNGLGGITGKSLVEHPLVAKIDITVGQARLSKATGIVDDNREAQTQEGQLVRLLAKS